MFRNLIARLLQRDRSISRRQLSRSERREAFLDALQSRAAAEVATWSSAFRSIMKQETRRRSASFQSYLMPALQFESLEDRRVLSSIVWVNRGDVSDNFDALFGAGAPANAARAVADAAIDAWERVVLDFNHAAGVTSASGTIAFSAVTLVNGTGADQFVIHPTHLIGTAALTVVANGGVRDDVVTIIATEADDVVTSTGDTITVNGTVPVTVGNGGAGFAEVQVIALGGDDHITLSLNLPGVRKFVDGGAGNDFSDMSGTVDAVIFGGAGDDTFIWNPGDGSDLIEGGTGNNAPYVGHE